MLNRIKNRYVKFVVAVVVASLVTTQLGTYDHSLTGGGGGGGGGGGVLPTPTPWPYQAIANLPLGTTTTGPYTVAISYCDSSGVCTTNLFSWDGYIVEGT
ncbi:MAG TPA: hypothetical protein VEZ14_08270 [Dehalococcoidia bacterium]|nr:hypothetical protein [Dehalococcoidia bacterium]